MPAGVARVEKSKRSRSFSSAEEMREVLTELLTDVDEDTELGRRLRSAQVSYRYVFPDLGLSLNIASSEETDHWIRWSFGEPQEGEPALTLEMSSEVANRYLQGRENLAIGVARGNIRCSSKARAALKLLPISGQLSESYRRVLQRRHPHLLLA